MRHLFPLVGLLFAVGTAAHGAVVTWDGGGNGQLASTPANWAGDHAPQPGDAIVLDGTCGKDVTWDLAIPVAAWTQTAAYTGTVIIRTTYDESFPALLIAGDCVVAGGRMGHPSNSGVPQWRLSLQVGGSLTLGSGAIIDVVGAGFTRHSGPGAGTAGNGGSHGGMGGRRSDTREVCTYGSFNEPTTLGSAGWEMGGGAVRLVVAGAARIDGVVNADGWAWYGQNSGAGGSIWITAGRVMGTGSIHANGGSPWEWNTGGGGGRVAITCTEPGAVVSGFAGIVQAVGGFCCDGQSGAAGTVYLRDAGQGLNQGTLIIANQGITDADVVSEIPAGQSWQLRRLVLRDGGRLGLPTGTILTVAPDTIIAPVQGNGGIRLGGGTLTVDGGLLTVANWRLVVDAPTTLNASLVVGMNGLVTHSGNHRWGRALPGLPQDGLGLYRCALTVTGDCTITNAGSISADGCGYGYNQGPGAIPAGNRGGGSHGGAGADYGDSHSAHPTYGVISAPVTLGSGGSWLAGGGAIRLTVGAATRIDGRLSANGSLWYGNDGGSGGSVWLTTASLTGTGVIQANGGGPSNGEWAASGGGGRVAVQVTGPAGFDAWAGGMSAVSPSAWATGAPGTVYTRAGTVGDLLVDNRGVEPTQSTVVPDDGSAVRHVTISGRARMVMPNRTMSGNMLVGEASAVSLPDGLTVAGSLVNFGNVSTSTGTVAISGDWSNHGTYAAGTATVVLAGSQPVVTGSSTFWNLVKDGGQATVTFTAGSTQTITNNLTLRGSDQGQLRLRSTQPGTAWFINPQAGRSTGWLSIQDSHNVNALDVDAGEGSSNAGNARKWNFFASVAPTIAVAASASPNPTDTGVSALSVLGADDGGEPSLIYTWSVASGPGAAQFTNNGTHAAANSIATFGAVGTYALVATIEDGRAQTATSAVTVAVTSIPSGQGQGTGLCGYYFPNTTFSGLSPGVIDPTVNFVWNGASPAASVPGEYFSVRWLGQIQPQFTEDLTLVLRTDDGVRVWLDGQMVINDWFGRGATDSRYTFPAQVGRRYDLRIDYYQGLGGAAAQLYWESGRLGRQIVPQSQLYPLETDVLTARLPKTSVVSPVCIEGQHGPGATLVGKVNGHVVHLSDLPDTAWFANVPLDDHAAVAVEAGASHGDIAWTPTDLSKEAKLTVRVNDAVLLRAPVALSYRVQVNCGVLGAEIAMSASSQHVYQFTQPGIYHLVSVNELGVTIGDVQVTVIGIDLDGPIACQVGYRREKGVDIVGGAVDQVVFTAADAGQLAVTVKESTPYGARLYLRPDRRGTPMLLARLASSRAIIAAQVIDEYTIETNALLHTVRNSKTGNGGATAVLRPWIPDLTGQFRMFFHAATFAGGGTSLDLSTNDIETFVDPVTGETCGRFRVELFIPEDETAYCFSLGMDQHSRHGTSTMTVTNVNGAICKFTVGSKVMCVCQSGHATLPVTADGNNKNVHLSGHSIQLVHTDANQTPVYGPTLSPADYNCKTAASVNWDPVVNVQLHNGHWMVSYGFWDVKIDDTTFPRELEIRNDLCTIGVSTPRPTGTLGQSVDVPITVVNGCNSFRLTGDWTIEQPAGQSNLTDIVAVIDPASDSTAQIEIGGNQTSHATIKMDDESQVGESSFRISGSLGGGGGEQGPGGYPIACSCVTSRTTIARIFEVNGTSAVTLTNAAGTPGHTVSIPMQIVNNNAGGSNYSLSISQVGAQGLLLPPLFTVAVPGMSAVQSSFDVEIPAEIEFPEGQDAVEFELVCVLEGPTLSAARQAVGNGTLTIFRLPPRPVITCEHSVIAAGGVATAIHQTNVTVAWENHLNYSGPVAISMSAAIGADNSETWWWNTGAIPSSVVIGGETISANETKVIQVNSSISGVMTSSNKEESAVVSAYSAEGGNGVLVEFSKGDFEIKFPLDENNEELKVLPVNEWCPAYIKKRLNGSPVSLHLVRVALETVTMTDGTVHSAALADNQGASISLSQFVQLDQAAIFDHSYQTAQLNDNEIGVPIQIRIKDNKVKSFKFWAFDFNVETE